MQARCGMMIGMLMLVMLAGCGTSAGDTATGPAATEVVAQAPPAAELEPAAAPEIATPEPPAEPKPTDAPKIATAEPPVERASTAAPEIATAEPAAAPEAPTSAPDDVIATLVGVQIGTFPQETDAAGETVPWNELVRTENIPNAGFFVTSASEGLQILRLDCQIVLNGLVVYQHEASATDLTLFAPEDLPDQSSNEYTFAAASFQWPDFAGDGTRAVIESGDYTLQVRGDMSDGTTVEQSFPFTISLAATPTSAP